MRQSLPMLPPELIAILALALVAWLWYDSLKAREAAVRAARTACRAEGALLLDDTVAIAALKFIRDDDGHIKLQRAYNFEYTDTGNNRLNGSIVMRGDRVLIINVGGGMPPQASPRGVRSEE